MACRPNDIEQISLGHFDCQKFLNETYNSKDRAGLRVKKIISYNGVSESMEISDYDLKEDMKILGKVNINNPNWIGKYDVDSTIIENILHKVNYTSLDPKLSVKTLEVNYNKGMVIGYEATYEKNHC